MTEAPTGRVRLVCETVVQTARLMVGVPDYQTYVAHRQSLHPDKPMMNYEEFFRERQARALRDRQGQVPRLLLKAPDCSWVPSAQRLASPEAEPLAGFG